MEKFISSIDPNQHSMTSLDQNQGKWIKTPEGTSLQNIKKREQIFPMDECQSKIIQMIVKEIPLEDVLTAIIEMIEIQSHNLLCSILLLDHDSNCLVHGAAPNLPKAYIQEIDGTEIGPSVGSCGSAAYLKRQVIVSDITKDPRWDNFREVALRNGLRACWSTPILDNQKKVLGTFAMYFHEPHYPTVLDFQLIGNAVYLARIAIDRDKTKEKLDRINYYDGLTSLPNRSFFLERISNELDKATGSSEVLGIMVIDIGRFRVINESFGQFCADQVLRQIAIRLEEHLIKKGTLFKLEGDKFGFTVLSESKEAILSTANDVVGVFKEPFTIENREFFVRPNVGISIYPYDGEERDGLLTKADMALHFSKKHGKNFSVYEPKMDEKTYDKFMMEIDLHRALEREELFLVYQPQICLQDNKIVGVEALIRWRHPEKGLISPEEFIAVAEETGQIVEIGEWVLRRASNDISRMIQAKGIHLSLSVNVSLRQFLEETFVNTVSSILKETSFDPQLLHVEITESMTMDLDYINVILKKLKKLGIKISMDDFGKGYSSLSYLSKLPIDKLKIDKSFVQDMDHKHIVNTIISMAKSLNILVVAEGVENEEQLDFLRKNQCDEAQGFLFFRPMPLEQLEAVFDIAGISG